MNQKNGGAQGNPNYVYYKLASKASFFCKSSGSVGESCIFHNVTEGDNDVNCGGTTDCFGATQSSSGVGRHPHGGGFGSAVSYNGALSTSTTSLLPAYQSGVGWNFATGLGSVNAYNLVTNWSAGK